MLNYRTVLAPSPKASQHEEDAAKDRSCWREKACARSYLTPVEADCVQEVREEAEGGRAVESRLAADTLKLREFLRKHTKIGSTSGNLQTSKTTMPLVKRVEALVSRSVAGQ